MSLLPYSPLAGGVLSGKYNDGATPAGARFTNYLNGGERQRKMVKRFINPQAEASTRRFAAIAQDINLSPVTLAVAWSKQHDFVASTIVGASELQQVDELLAAADVTLSAETLQRINEVSREIRYPMG